MDEQCPGSGHTLASPDDKLLLRRDSVAMPCALSRHASPRRRQALSKLPKSATEFETCHDVVGPNNVVEADHGWLTARLRPMRGLKTLRSIATGRAFVQNLRRGHSELTIEGRPKIVEHVVDRGCHGRILPHLR
jgi:hypothetical protein